MLFFLFNVPTTLSHHHLNTVPKSIISFRCSKQKSENYLEKGRENPPRSEIKLKPFGNHLYSPNMLTHAKMMTKLWGEIPRVRHQLVSR